MLLETGPRLSTSSRAYTGDSARRLIAAGGLSIHVFFMHQFLGYELPDIFSVIGTPLFPPALIALILFRAPRGSLKKKIQSLLEN